MTVGEVKAAIGGLSDQAEVVVVCEPEARSYRLIGVREENGTVRFDIDDEDEDEDDNPEFPKLPPLKLRGV